MTKSEVIRAILLSQIELMMVAEEEEERSLSTSKGGGLSSSHIPKWLVRSFNHNDEASVTQCPMKNWISLVATTTNRCTPIILH